MTCDFRQGLSILLSCLLYRHHITIFGIVGVLIVFVAIFLRIYYGHRERQRKVIQAANVSVSKV